MRGKRAKLIRKLVDGLDKTDHAQYDEVRFMRKRRKYAADGTYELVDHYPVRTLFLVKCKRAAYQRFKRLPKPQQDNLLKLVQSM